MGRGEFGEYYVSPARCYLYTVSRSLQRTSRWPFRSTLDDFITKTGVLIAFS